MTIWVDADSCPAVVRSILIKAAQRTGEPLVFVANHSIAVPTTPHISNLIVPPGFDVADNEIVKRAHTGDLVITSDIPLAAEVLAEGAAAVSSRGEPFDKETIGQRLNMRDFMDTMRGSGVHTGGPAAYGQKERQAFANYLDRWLQRKSNLSP